MQKLSTQHWIDTAKKKQKDFDVKENLDRLRNIKADLSVQLTGTMVTMTEMLKVRTNDVICLDNGKNDDFTVVIQGQPKFLGRIGYKGNKRAVQITSVISPFDLEFDELVGNNNVKDEGEKSV